MKYTHIHSCILSLSLSHPCLGRRAPEDLQGFGFLRGAGCPRWDPPEQKGSNEVSWSCRSHATDGIGTPDPNPRNLVNWCF